MRCRCYGHLDFLDKAKDALAKADWFERFADLVTGLGSILLFCLVGFLEA